MIFTLFLKNRSNGNRFKNIKRKSIKNFSKLIIINTFFLGLKKKKKVFFYFSLTLSDPIRLYRIFELHF